MAEIVASLQALPDADIQAMAIYLASLDPAVPSADDEARRAVAAVAASEAAEVQARVTVPRGARLFDGACASCHAAGSALPSLALASALHGEHPDNVVQAVLGGIEIPSHGLDADGAMPAFSGVFDDSQVADLLGYLRARFAPDKPAWGDLAGTAARIRAAPHG